MDRQFRWGAALAAVVFAAFVGIASYNAGVSHGLAMAPEAGRMVGPYGWYRPWPGFFFGPFVLILFWVLVARTFFWRGFYRRRWSYAGPHDVPPAFDEWHRRAHERAGDRPDAAPPRP